MNLFDMFESKGKYILYFNDKPVSVYKSAEDAEYQARLVQKKVPDLQFSIKQEVCKLTPVELQENLRDWFKDKWVRFGPDGKIRGDCARGDDSEGKPKCLPQSKAHALGKKGRAKAAARKRRQDPNPERSGAAINVKTKEDKQATLPSDAVRKIQKLLNDKFDANLDVDGILGPLTIKSIRKFMPGSMKKLAPNPKRTTAVQGKELKKTDENISEEQLDEKCWDTHKQVGMKKKGNKMVPDCVPKESIEEAKAEMCPECGGPMFSELLINEKKDACYYKVKSRYKVWPSAYASGALVKCRKKGAKNWGSKSESVGESYDKWGWHTSVKNGEFMPTKYGNKAYVYLHDLDNESPRGGPQLVTVNKPTVAKRIAQQFGGKVVKTDLNTYRIVKPAEQEVEEGVGKDLAKLGGMSALAVGAGLAGNYADQQHPKVDIGGQQAYLIKNPGLGRVPDTAMILKGKDGKTYKVWSPSRNNKTLYATPVDDIKEGVAEGSDTTTFNEFHEWKEAVYNLGADITQMGKAGQYTAIGSNGVIGEFNGRTNTGWIKGQQGVAEVSNATLKSYQQKVSADSMKHSADPTKRSPEKASRSVAGFAKAQKRLEKGVAEAGPFSYGAKKPRKGSVADLAAKKRKEQERGKQPIEPKDQMVGVAKVTKGVAESAVEAYGYVYDKRDQRIVWRKIFPSIEAAQAWADKKNATIIGTKPADVKEEIDTGITKVDNDIKSIDQGIGEDQDKIDTVEMDVPFLIRALEYAREDAKDDLDLHNVVERMLQAAQNGEALDMADYNRVFGQSTEPVSEDDLGVEPKRPPRKGSRHERGHEPVPRYHYHKDVEEGWGAERQQREHEATQKEWADVLERHKDNPQVMKILKDLQAKFWRGRDAEAKALAVVNGDTRQYYETIGTPDDKLREEFQMRKDSNGWYLKEDASRKLKLEALRAFGPPRNMI